MVGVALQPVLDIDLNGNPGPLHFETLEQLEQSIQEEQAAWQPLIQSARQLNQNGHGNFIPITQRQHDTLNTIAQQINQQRQASRGAAAISSAPFQNILSPYLNGICIHSKSLLGRTILNVSKTTPAEAILMFLTLPNATANMVQTNQGGFQAVALVGGIIRAKLLQLGLLDISAEHRQRLDEIAKTGQNLVIDLERERTKFTEQSDKSLSEAEKKYQEFVASEAAAVDAANLATSEATRLFEEQREQHLTAMNSIEAAFREDMKLRAPRGYWSEKSVRHRTASKYWSGAFWIGSLATLLFLYLWGQRIIELVKAPSSSIPGVEWVLIVVPALIVLWLLRFLHGQATTNLALMRDADERVTMVETYLALVSEGKIDSVERPLVLQPLFRASASTSGEEGMIKGLAERAIDLLSKR